MFKNYSQTNMNMNFLHKLMQKDQILQHLRGQFSWFYWTSFDRLNDCVSPCLSSGVVFDMLPCPDCEQNKAQHPLSTDMMLLQSFPKP